MKKLLIIFFLSSLQLFAQKFVVEKVSGKVEALIGTSEKWIQIHKGDKLTGSDLLSTNKNSYVLLRRDKSKFLLKSNAALGLNNIRKLSINDLLLALAMEEIENVPKKQENGITRNTAVYGTNESESNTKVPFIKDKLGVKKLNGAKLLAENGYRESAVIVAKETYRKYPATKKLISDRLYFVNVLKNLGLYQEANGELQNIKKIHLDKRWKYKVEKIENEIKMKLLSK